MSDKPVLLAMEARFLKVNTYRLQRRLKILGAPSYSHIKWKAKAARLFYLPSKMVKSEWLKQWKVFVNFVKMSPVQLGCTF